MKVDLEWVRLALLGHAKLSEADADLLLEEVRAARLRIESLEAALRRIEKDGAIGSANCARHALAFPSVPTGAGFRVMGHDAGGNPVLSRLFCDAETMVWVEAGQCHHPYRCVEDVGHEGDHTHGTVRWANEHILAPPVLGAAQACSHDGPCAIVTFDDPAPEKEVHGVPLADARDGDSERGRRNAGGDWRDLPAGEAPAPVAAAPKKAALKEGGGAESILEEQLCVATARLRELGHAEVVNEDESCCDACDRAIAAERIAHPRAAQPPAPPAAPAPLRDDLFWVPEYNGWYAADPLHGKGHGLTKDIDQARKFQTMDECMEWIVFVNEGYKPAEHMNVRSMPVPPLHEKQPSRSAAPAPGDAVAALEAAAQEYDKPDLYDVKVYCRHVAEFLRRQAAAIRARASDATSAGGGE